MLIVMNVILNWIIFGYIIFSRYLNTKRLLLLLFNQHSHLSGHRIEAKPLQEWNNGPGRMINKVTLVQQLHEVMFCQKGSSPMIK